jgi:hypothetical protein
MKEFIEYVKKEFKKQNPDRNPYKRSRPKNETLEADSISEITDCNDDGILSQSRHKLGASSKRRLDKYLSELRVFKGYKLKKHNCLEKQRPVHGDSMLVEMQMKTISPPRSFGELSVSAH